MTKRVLVKKKCGRKPLDIPIRDRIMARVIVRESGCWEWQGTGTRQGYGHIWHNGRNAAPHRIMYEQDRGAIPEGLHIDHLCRNPPCCNPEHLEAVTPGENVRRGIPFKTLPPPVTHCKHGHEYTASNTRWGKVRGRGPYKFCLTCERARGRARAASNAAGR